MNVLFIPSWYSSNEGDLNGSFIRDQALDIKERGVNTSVVYASGFQANKLSAQILKKFFTFKFFIESGIPTYRIAFLKLAKFDFINRGLWVFFMKRLIARFIRDNGIPDIIHVHSIMWGGIVGKWAHEKYNIPFIITEHRGRFVSGSGFHIPEGYKTTFSKVLKSTRRLILVSKAQEDYFKEFTDRISVIPNYVGNHFLKTRPKPNMGNPIKLINVCHLTKQKNVSTLIEALHLLRCKRKNVVLEIIGDGSERRPLEELVRHLDLTEYVSFHGAIKNDDLPALLKSADIFVLPSLFESFGIALVEAMACGLPVIGPKNGGPSYFINNQNGRIVDTTNIEEMAKAILSILDQNPDRLQIQQFVNEHFTKEKVLTEILNEYESAGNY